MLDRQIQIYSVDTGNFYSGKESHLHWLNHKLRSERNRLVEDIKDIESEFDKLGIELDDAALCDSADVQKMAERYAVLKELVKMKNAKINESKDRLLSILSNKVEENIRTGGTHHIRELSENQVAEKNIISVFDSYFTRTIGAEPDRLCEDFMVVQVYYFDVIKDLIYNGFSYKGEKYIYFTSSAGQIRTKKTVFIKESVWNKYEKSIMCGLTIDDINAKGGNNPNKHLAYLALANSATDVWDEFDIDKTIVIDDFETDVFGTYDLVDDSDYSIKRVSDYVPVPHTDGAGMMLPCMGKNRMVRLPWVKGLLGSFDFKKFIEVNGCSSVVKDIYGKEHDVIAEDIQIIFTKSQFKMWKYYDSWEHYKEMFKKYGCTAGMTNIEEDRINDATINYQMLQSLTDITDDEILEIAKSSIDKLNNLCSSSDNIKTVFGATPYNMNKTPFQKAIDIYPSLLNDEYSKFHLREIKNSMVKKYKAGKLQVRGKYTFILPDFYAACEYWFMGIDNPEGLLKDGEVFCWLFRKNDKLDCLRSPHLYREHAIRKNVAWNGIDCHRRDWIRQWYCTDAVYTSCHDLISKILQFDVDGDKALVVADEAIVKIAERNMNGIAPLYYNMKKAEPVTICNETIYNGLNAAFSGGNIGIYSNNISKIWNSDVFVNGSDDEKQQAIDIIKLLCMENNFVIDYAKTLYKPERPKDIGKLITDYTKENLPYFFKYAKDKNDYQIVDANGSFVNKLNDIIPNPRINCRKLKLDSIDCKLLMNNPEIEFDVELTSNGKLIKENTNPVIVKYCELSKEYYLSLGDALLVDQTFSPEVLMKSNVKRSLKYKKAQDDIKYELSQFGYDDMEVADILVKFLYGISKSKHKSALWLCYGDILLNNLENNNVKSRTKTIQCVDCGDWFEVDVFDSATERCEDCYKEYRKQRKLETQRERRRKAKMKSDPSTLVNNI